MQASYRQAYEWYEKCKEYYYSDPYHGKIMAVSNDNLDDEEGDANKYGSQGIIFSPDPAVKRKIIFQQVLHDNIPFKELLRLSMNNIHYFGRRSYIYNL